MPEVPTTRFARSGDVHLAYQVVGRGPIDLLFLDTWVHHVEMVWDIPEFAHLLRRLSSFSRLIHFDRRGTGLSDPVATDALPDLETQVADVLAVLDAAESERPAVFSVADGSLISMLLAATHPDRCSSLVLFVPAAMQVRTPDHPLGLTPEFIEEAGKIMTAGLLEGGGGLEWLAPSRAGDERFAAQVGRQQRSSVRPGAIAHYYRQSFLSDVRHVLPIIRVPSLVLHRTDNLVAPIELAREVAALIPGAGMVELPGTDVLAFSGDIDRLADEIEEFLTGTRPAPEPDRVLATVMFADIVGSTQHLARMGDRQWKDLLTSHYELVRRELGHARGRLVAISGDGVMATFDGPGRAVRCAVAIAHAARALGLEVRTGLHAGEIELFGDDVAGMAVHIAARISALAEPGETLVSSTVKDLLVGSGIEFESRGEHHLKGVPEPWRLFAAGRER